MIEFRSGGINGINGIRMQVSKQSGTNTVAVVEGVKHRLDEIRAVLPSDISVQVIRDQSRFIQNSIHEVKVHLLLAAVLVSLTILLFMRDWRTTRTSAVSEWSGARRRSVKASGIMVQMARIAADTDMVRQPCAPMIQPTIGGHSAPAT